MRSTRLIFLVLVSHCWWTLGWALPFVLSFFDIGHLLLVEFDLCASIRLVIFFIGQPLLVDFNLCTHTRLVFFTLVNHCWWTLTFRVNCRSYE